MDSDGEKPVNRKEFDKYFEDSEDELDRENERVKRRKIDEVAANKAQDGEEDMANDVERDLEEKVMPFNQRDDREDGYFDEDGAYREQNKVEDAWLDEIDEGRTAAATTSRKVAAGNVDRLLQKGSIHLPPGMSADGSSGSSSADEESIKSTKDDELTIDHQVQLREKIRSLLEPGENVSKALAKFNGKNRKKNPKKRSRSQRKKRSWEADSDEDNGDENMDSELSAKKLAELSECVNALVSRGSDWGIYEDTADTLERKLKPARAQMEGWKRAHKQWFYKVKPDDAKVEGPYSGADMKAWHAKGYFKEIVLRKVNANEWTHASKFDFTKL